MEEIVTILAREIPIGLVILATVWLFLKKGGSMNQSWAKTVETISSSNDETHRDCTKAVKENTKILTQVAALIEQRIKQTGG